MTPKPTTQIVWPGGAIMRQARLDKGLSQRALAKALCDMGILKHPDFQIIYRWETGTVEPRALAQAAIAYALGLKVADLIGPIGGPE